MRLSTSKSNFTENIFKNQKQNIQKQKIINNMEISLWALIGGVGFATLFTIQIVKLLAK